MLDAARKSKDPALFQRSVDMALQARSGEAALQAAQSWKKEIPTATEASRYVLQILLALNRIEEAGKAVAVLLNELPLDEQPGAIVSIPRLFGVSQDKVLAAGVVEKALAQSLAQPQTAAAAWTTLGRMRRDAGQNSLAVAAVLKGHAAETQSPGTVDLGAQLVGFRKKHAQAGARRRDENRGLARIADGLFARLAELAIAQRGRRTTDHPQQQTPRVFRWLAAAWPHVA